MEIIKLGHIKGAQYRVTCSECGTVFQFYEQEAIKDSHNHISVRCPACASINQATDKDLFVPSDFFSVNPKVFLSVTKNSYEIRMSARAYELLGKPHYINFIVKQDKRKIYICKSAKGIGVPVKLGSSHCGTRNREVFKRVSEVLPDFTGTYRILGCYSMGTLIFTVGKEGF